MYVKLSHLLPCPECALGPDNVYGPTQQTSSAAAHSRHVCCVKQWTFLLCDKAAILFIFKEGGIYQCLLLTIYITTVLRGGMSPPPLDIFVQFHVPGGCPPPPAVQSKTYVPPPPFCNRKSMFPPPPLRNLKWPNTFKFAIRIKSVFVGFVFSEF